MKLLKMAVVVVVLSILVTPCWGATINVPADQPTIQGGINAATDGDIVMIADGTYSGAGNYNIDFKGKEITVKSENGPGVCIINCQQLGRGFFFYSGETDTSVLEGLTIQNGQAPGPNFRGGGLKCENSSPAIIECDFGNNLASDGGAVSLWQSKAKFDACSFLNNSALSEGGGLYAYNSDLRITGCIFTGGNADFGGAIHSNGTAFFIDDCVFTNNTAERDGGGLHSYDSTSSFHFTGCRFSDNLAPEGGAVYCRASRTKTSTFTACTFLNNSSTYRAGAIYLYSLSYFRNCIFYGNDARYGGAIYSDYTCTSSFMNSTISNNNALDQGGAIWSNDSSHLNFINCIVWGNNAQSGSQLYEENGYANISYSNIENGIGGLGCIDADPFFLDVENDNFHLQEGSPCIDTGTDEGAPEDDLDGYLRPILCGYDMGAYEFMYPVFNWGGTSDNWNDINNWDRLDTPRPVNSVIIENSTVNPVIQVDDAEAGILTIKSGSLTIEQGKLTIASPGCSS